MLLDKQLLEDKKQMVGITGRFSQWEKLMTVVLQAVCVVVAMMSCMFNKHVETGCLVMFYSFPIH